MEWAAPLAVRRVAPRVLPRLGAVSEIGQVGIDAALERNIALADVIAKAVEVSLAAQVLELRVRVEYQRGPSEPAREPGAVRMEPDDEERGPAEAEGEARIAGVAAHGWIPGGGSNVAV